MSVPGGFDLRQTYVQLEGAGGARALRVHEGFWEELASQPDLQDGWLVCVSSMEGGSSPWEMHPEGDEVLCLMAGEIDIVLEEEKAERVVRLRPGQTCIVPRGLWHRQVVRRPAKLLSITAGKGTQHRGRGSSAGALLPR